MPPARSRSASPARGERQKPRTSGFKWKEKKPQDGEQKDARDKGRLERGYRNRSPKRELRAHQVDRNERTAAKRERSAPDGQVGLIPGAEKRSDGERPAAATQSGRPDGVDDAPPGAKPSVMDKFGDYKPKVAAASKGAADPTGAAAQAAPAETKKKPKKPRSTVPTSPMIIVHVNDRLGTKAAIPCLASDSIRAFKAVVAAHIGRQPHEIMLKRQGERPFKDQLTLEDYGVSSGVQLDLELDTGD